MYTIMTYHYLQRLRRRIGRAAARCGCRARTDVAPPAASQRSGAAAASSSHVGTRQSTRSSSRTPTFSQGDDDDDEAEQDDEEEHEDEEASTHDEIGMSQMPDAPSTQASQRPRHSAHPPSTYTLGTDALAKGKGRAKRQ